jgi:hypothetical protein
MKTVEFDIEVCQDDTPVRGNAMCSGDADVDRAAEDEILADLDDGNVWAWASVKVTARIGSIEASDYLGCCSYESEEDFRKCPYYFDMKAEALSALRDKIHGCISAIDRAESIVGQEREDAKDVTDVVFLKDSDGDGIFAVFPTLRERDDCFVCYSPIGQHSSASIHYCDGCEETTDPGEYANLSGELLCVGYKLRIVGKERIGIELVDRYEAKEGCDG